MSLSKTAAASTPGPDVGADTGPAISISGLEFAFGKRPVLTGINLEIPRGAAFGILGANGAGKLVLAETTFQIRTLIMARQPPPEFPVSVTGDALLPEDKIIGVTVGDTAKAYAMRFDQGQYNLTYLTVSSLI